MIGVEKDSIIRRFVTGLPNRMEAARHGIELHGALIEADEIPAKSSPFSAFIL